MHAHHVHSKEVGTFLCWSDAGNKREHRGRSANRKRALLRVEVNVEATSFSDAVVEPGDFILFGSLYIFISTSPSPTYNKTSCKGYVKML